MFADPAHTACRYRAFTIIELLVAASLTVLLIGLLLGMVTNVLAGWNRTSGAAEAATQARAIFALLERDISGAIVRREGGAWLVASIERSTVAPATWAPGANGFAKPVSGSEGVDRPGSSLNLAPASGALVDARFGQAGVWLRLITSHQGENQTSDQATLSAPVAVAYQIVRQPVTRGERAEVGYVLFRSQVSPVRTFLSGYDLLSADYQTGSPAPTPHSEGELRVPLWESALATNVIDFGVRVSGRGPTGERQLLFPATEAGAPSQANLHFVATAVGSSSLPAGWPEAHAVRRGVPEEIEVMVRILTEEGARRLRALEYPPDGRAPILPEGGVDGGDHWWRVAVENSYVFTWRITVEATSP